MMLPSGNDAAQALAVYCGHLILTDGALDPNPNFVLTKAEIEERLKYQMIR